MTVSQSIFNTALLDPTQPVPEGLSDAASRPAGRRFNVYRNNVAVSLTEAMHKAFPVITKLLGAQNMDGLAGLFLRAHPPDTPLMMHYGEAFPGFLQNMDQLSHLGYLPDVARLELAIRQSYHAADAEPIEPETLGETPPETLLQSKLRFAPAMRILRSDWPIFDIWRFNMEDGAPKPQAQAQDVLITRPEFDPLPNPLPDGAADWVEAVDKRHTIAEALDIASDTAPDFDLGATLALLLQGGAIISLNSKD